MKSQMVTRLASIVLFSILMIDHVDLINAKKDDITGLVQLAQKDFGAFLQHAAESASKSIISKLNSKFKDKALYTLQEADIDSLHIYQGQVLDVALDVGNTPHRIYIGGPQKEEQWQALRRMLPESQGGIRLHPDFDLIEANLVRPLRDGAVLPDFTLEGPLDLFLTPAADLQLWLPHSVDSGVQKRVMLRAGVAVTVRGARSVQLRRPIDLPEISLADFVDFALEDKDKHQAAGLMHLATGLREKATQHWNTSSSKTRRRGDDEKKMPITPALVALDVDFSQGSEDSGKSSSSSSSGKRKGQGTLFAAPDEHGALQKLRVKRMGDGVIEISIRGIGLESEASGGSGSRLSVENSKALVLGRPGSPYVWPFRGASPETVTTYEHLLRELLSRQIFSSSSSSTSKKARTKGYSNQKDGAAGATIAPEVPLKLQRSSATAVFLMKMEMAVMRKPILPASSSTSTDPTSIDNKGENKVEKRLQKDVKKENEKGDPPTPGQLLIKTGTGGGVVDDDDLNTASARPRREVYSTVVKIEGSVQEGNLRFSPIGPLQLVERTSDTTATFEMPGALAQVAGELGLGGLSNASLAHVRDEL